MGFRCIGCGKNFGLDKEALYYHLERKSGECAGYAYVALTGINRMCGKKSKEDKVIAAKNRVPKSYSQISPNHHWEKQNIIGD